MAWTPWGRAHHPGLGSLRAGPFEAHGGPAAELGRLEFPRGAALRIEPRVHSAHGPLRARLLLQVEGPEIAASPLELARGLDVRLEAGRHRIVGEDLARRFGSSRVEDGGVFVLHAADSL